MSHLATIETQIRDVHAIRAACGRLSIAPPQEGTHNVWYRPVSGLGVKLDGWLYPIVIDPKTGAVQYDNHNGAWGDPAKLSEFRQAYAIEAIRRQCAAKGIRVKSITQTAAGGYKIVAEDRATIISR